VHGPYEPAAGHPFNPNKLLIDPYAKQMIGHIEWNPALFGYQVESGDDMTFDERDSAPYAMKAAVVDTAFTWRNGRWRIPWENTVVYEAHVRGLTKRYPALPEALRGTYAGLASVEITGYLGSLGVSTVELLPVHTFVDDSYLLDKGLKNYWGYNTIGFFAPARRYAANADFAFAEFKEMVAHLHDAGLELGKELVRHPVSRAEILNELL
jgi:glycogen operon protein